MVIAETEFLRGGELLGTVKGSGKKPYEIFGHPGGVLRCTCPAWRFQKDKLPKDRTCKHLKLFEDVRRRSEFFSVDPRVTFVME